MKSLFFTLTLTISSEQFVLEKVNKSKKEITIIF